jgi:peroxiredoxin Q/BCP
MVQLHQDYSAFVARDAEIVVVGPENAPSFADYWDRHDFPFIGLPDPDHEVADLYGQEVKLLALGRLPALVVIDKAGDIRYAHFGHSMRDIPDNDEILALLDELQQEDGNAYV